MEHSRDEETEAVLEDIIAHGSDVVFSFLNDTDGLEEQGEEADYGDRKMEEEGSGDPMPAQEGHRDDGSGDRTESGKVYILIKPVLTS